MIRRHRVLKDTAQRTQDIEMLQSKSLVFLTQQLASKFSVVGSPLSDENVEDTPQRLAHYLFPPRASGAFPSRRK